MFLKSLSMKGFKSFADATVLDLEPGVTVIVGPNGSGKSNVVDAVAWVLGAQAPSAVRSQKMDDVIFAGTQKRQALGRAEVSLTIDNTARLLPIDFEEITVTRTLFRTGESEYQLNGVPCRLLDIQELLSDSGVGRQQHVIVSQGQIDGVLDARPEDRRAIIEEAAGVLKFRRRKEKAERRLKATQENLVRVQDLQREVRRQLRPLERQAEAARRHGGLVAELQTLQLYLAGRRITELRTRLKALQATRAELTTTGAELEARLVRLDTEIAAAEVRVTSLGGHGLSDRLTRAEGLRERALGLDAVLRERVGSLRRELESSVDEGVIESLEAESARLRTELSAVVAEHDSLEPAVVEIAVAEAEINEQRSLFDQERADAPTQPTGEAAEVRGELSAIESALAMTLADEARLGEQLTSARSRSAQLEAEVDRHTAQRRRLAADVETLRERLTHREAARSEQARLLDEAEEQRHVAAADRQAWTARADALSMAIDEARASSGAERLAAVQGVLGTLRELIDIDAGWEAAFEAAAGDALAAVVVADAATGRRAIEELQRDQLAGAVLSAGARAGPPSPTPGIVRRHVRATDEGVARLLDALVGPVVFAQSWVEAVDIAVARPDQVVVTAAGDRFGPSGWRIGTGASGATSAALEEAVAQAEQAIGRLDHAGAMVSAATAALEGAGAAVEADVAELQVARDRLEAVTQALQRIESDRSAAGALCDSLETQLADLAQRHEGARLRHRELSEQLPALAAVESELLQRDRELDETRHRLETEVTEVGSRRTRLEVRTAQLSERRQFLEQRLVEIDHRLAGYAEARDQAARRRESLERRLALVEAIRGVVTDRAASIEAEVVALRRERQRQSDEARAAALQLDQLRRSRHDDEKQLGELRERTNRCDLDEAEATIKLESVIEALRRDLDCEPGRAVATECPELADGTSASARVRELERELRLMGPVNPLALEEFEALQERQQFLQGQLDDVRGSRRELAKVIRAVDAEIELVFAAAFADVSVNFESLFTTLFPGGQGRLELTEPDNLLETGIEVEAKPSGKNVKKLSLLSGGERSLTALAFLFAVFRSRPSPFYVMDEVEAALDDVNLHRFLQLVAEFRSEAQLLIVSHQKRTMEAADCLYGVTMQPGGSSRAISERVSPDLPAVDPAATPERAAASI